MSESDDALPGREVDQIICLVTSDNKVTNPVIVRHNQALRRAFSNFFSISPTSESVAIGSPSIFGGSPKHNAIYRRDLFSLISEWPTPLIARVIEPLGIRSPATSSLEAICGLLRDIWVVSLTKLPVEESHV